MPTGPIIKEGFPLIGVMLIITIIAAYFGYYSIAIITFILALFFMNFFRNPKRNIPTDPDAILSPADGKVMEIEDVYEDLYLHRECKKVTIFLSVFDDLDSILERGQLYGMIKFGSCTEIYMDKNVEICIKKGQHITGGDTIIGRLHHE